jgi:ribosome-binding factor A
MKRRQPSQEAMKTLCSDLGPEDGIDPRDLMQPGGKKGGRKTRQLCGQVAEALNYALGAVCNDDLLRDCVVVAVQAAPNEGRLLVTVAPALPGPFDADAVLAGLQRAIGKLRAKIAAAITRKRVPELAFRVLNERPAE